MGMASNTSRTATCTKATTLIINSRARGPTIGQAGQYIPASSSKAKDVGTGSGSQVGKSVTGTKVSTCRTRKMVRVSTLGPMGQCTRVLSSRI